VYGRIPPEADAVAVPSVPPLQLTSVELATDVAIIVGGAVRVVEFVLVQPLASVTVTVNVPTPSPVAVCVVWPEGFQAYVYGKVPPTATAVIAPSLPPLQCKLYPLYPGEVTLTSITGTVMEYENVCEPFVGQALSLTITMNEYGCDLASAKVGVQVKVPTGFNIPDVVNVAPGITSFQYIRTVSVGFGSVELTVKDIVLPGQPTVAKIFVPLIPEAIGNKFGLHTLVKNCMSRITLPIRTPFLYSRTRIAVTPISPFTVAFMLMSPLLEFKLTAGLDDKGDAAE